MTKLSWERFDLNTAEMNRNNQADRREVVPGKFPLSSEHIEH